MEYPKISIVTPSFNQGQFLEETILSVITQGYPNLEYIIIDGGSTDHSVEIIRKYEQHLSYWVSEPDKGMYYALQKGFEKSTGEIMGWLNSDDMLHPKALFSIAEILSIPGVKWMTGLPNVFDEMGRTVNVKDLGKRCRLRHVTDNVFIQQDCTYWRRELWNMAGAYLDKEFKLAGDFELWDRFFKYEKLYTTNCLTGGFRLSQSGQLSQNVDAYFTEVEKVLKITLEDASIMEKVKKLNKYKRFKKLLSRSRILNLGFLVTRIDRRINALYDYPEEIVFDREKQNFVLRNN
ncbi:MAG: glycosyltransferase [Chitinophagaceae bacterium]|nr:glycosyltransferase [Chitinophagaceae bacterium]